MINPRKINLLSNRLRLAPFNSADLALFIELATCPVIMNHVFDPMSRQEAIDAFKIKVLPWTFSSNQWLTLSITELTSREKIGNIGLKIVDHRTKVAEVGFMIKQSVQGKGYATEALSLIKDYAFDELKLTQLVAICAVNNYASAKLLEKSQFQRQQLLPRNTLINQQWIDDYLYSCSHII